MDGNTTRRRALALCGSGILASLAGCVGGEDDETNGVANGNSGTESTTGASGPPSEEGFFEELVWEANYRFEFSDQFSEGEGQMRNGDMYIRSEEDGLSIEMYRIGEAMYMVEGGECQKVSMDTPGMEFEEQGVNLDEVNDFAEEPSVENVGTDTIDGESVTVFEITYPDRPNHPERMYILDSGHLRRVESDSETTNFFDWGSVEPIEPPDMDCVDMEFPGSEDSDFGY